MIEVIMMSSTKPFNYVTDEFDPVDLTVEDPDEFTDVSRTAYQNIFIEMNFNMELE